uniref:ANK_REP_REGION domain-containing protein n=1 Tax=Gongylonema pulchrum TaxID=637853 RepID=A0A183F0R8_9BILA
LLDSRVCNLDRANKAGYTAVMLAALCDASDELESAVIHRLFQLGDINAQAVQVCEMRIKLYKKWKNLFSPNFRIESLLLASPIRNIEPKKTFLYPKNERRSLLSICLLDFA